MYNSLLAPERRQTTGKEREGTGGCDRQCQKSFPCFKVHFSSLYHHSPSPAFILPRVFRVFSTCTLYPHSQCMIQSPSGTPACKTCLCKNKINKVSSLYKTRNLQLTATNTSSLKTAKILCSIPGSFFSQGAFRSLTQMG